MKKVFYIPVLLFTAALTMVSCDGLLNVNSEQYTFDEQYRMGSESDSLYAFVGILSKLQLLGDRYVLLGELRGELMETSDDASRFLKEINEFSITKDNPYAKPAVYYDIINNCNYVIKYVDTTKVAASNRYNLKVMAMAKAIRAWTYLQLALNYKEVNYITEPMLDEEDVTIQYTPIGLYALCDTLIKDLYPFYQSERIGTYNLGQFGDFNTRYALFPIRFLLGDLYLWRGSILEGQNDLTGAKDNYGKAADMYYNLIVNNSLSITRTNATEWNFDDLTRLPTTIRVENWPSVYNMQFAEVITALVSSAEYGKQFILDSLTFNRKLLPTSVSMAYWDEQVYAETSTLVTNGDLRKRGSIGTEYTNSAMTKFEFDGPTIMKFIRTSSEKQKAIIIYRNSLLYLRYAEAVNRLGLPKLAFATIKNGLNRDLEYDTVIVNEISRKMGTTPSYMRFSTGVFNATSNNRFTNVGTHMRGCGPHLGNYIYTYVGSTNNKSQAVSADTSYYKVPTNLSETATVAYVEDKIIEELALETAFEGNRFHDLMRIAIRRNDKAYLADRVSAKYQNKAYMRSVLLNDNSWYLPK